MSDTFTIPQILRTLLGTPVVDPQGAECDRCGLRYDETPLRELLPDLAAQADEALALNVSKAQRAYELMRAVQRLARIHDTPGWMEELMDILALHAALPMMGEGYGLTVRPAYTPADKAAWIAAYAERAAREGWPASTCLLAISGVAASLETHLSAPSDPESVEAKLLAHAEGLGRGPGAGMVDARGTMREAANTIRELRALIAVAERTLETRLGAEVP